MDQKSLCLLGRRARECLQTNFLNHKHVPDLPNLQKWRETIRSRSEWISSQWLCCSSFAPKSHPSRQKWLNIRANYHLVFSRSAAAVICRPLGQNPAGYASQVHRRELLHELCSSRHFGSGRGFTCLKVYQMEGRPMRVVHLVLVALSEKQVGPLPRVGSRSRFELV